MLFDIRNNKGQGVVEYAVLLAAIVSTVVVFLIRNDGIFKTEISTTIRATESVLQQGR